MSLNYKIKNYLTYKLKAKNEFSLHSPFMFDLYNEVFKIAKKGTKEFASIEKIRHKLFNDHSIIHFTDFGAGGENTKISERKLSDIAKKTGKRTKYARFLAYLGSYLNSKEILELGTSVGISSMYFAHKNRAAHITTIEGCNEIHLKAKEIFQKNGFGSINALEGNFDFILPVLNVNKKFDLIYIDGNHTYEATKRYFEWFKQTATNETVIVFDDIYWSEGMTRAWKEIVSDESVTASIDMFEFGIVFFRKELSKQHFILRY